MTEQEYRSKREEVIAKFTKEFAESNYNTDPAFRQVIEALIRGVDPYTIIERLIEDRKSLVEKMEYFLKYHSYPQPIVIPKQEGNDEKQG